MPSDRKNIYEAIDAERTAQDAQWGGSIHDDTREAPDWLDSIAYQGDEIVACWAAGGPANGDEVRRRFVKIAALAVAAIESHDRIVAALNGGRPSASPRTLPHPSELDDQIGHGV